MKIYLVGGAVRDQLLNLPIKERDWVVVGASPKEMKEKGYRQVGKEFPVFLHPKTNEEYALARKERKTLPGYTGFEFDADPTVTLEEDLERRDLTINAMAQSESGELIDPFHGKKDIQAKILRHVSNAFPEDPVRILRVARFMARYAHLGFHVARETMHLMRQMVNMGEVNALVPERVWKELERALGEKNPEQFFEILNSCDAGAVLFKEVVDDQKSQDTLKIASEMTHLPNIRFACFLHHLAKEKIIALCERFRLPNAYRELALMVSVFFKETISFKNLSAEALVDLFGKLDIYRRFERFDAFLIACDVIALQAGVSFNREKLKEGALIAKNYDVHVLLSKGLQNEALVSALRAERVVEITKWLALTP